MKRVLGHAWISALFVLLLSTTVAAESTTITLWHWETPPHRVRGMQVVLDRFEEETGIKVVQEPINFADLQRKLLGAIATQQLPELILVNPPQMMTLLRHDAILEGAELFADLDAAYEFPEALAAWYQVAGKQYGIPIFGIAWPLQVRTDLLEVAGLQRPPQTWNELLAFAKANTRDVDGDGRIDIYGFGLPVSKNGNYGSQVVWGFVRSNGGDVVDATSATERIIFDSPATIETYEFLADLAAYTVPGAANMDWGMGELQLKSGRVAAMVYTCGFLSELDRTDPELAAKYETTLLPVAPSGNRSHTAYVRAVSLTTSAAEKYEAVSTFLRWLYKPKNYAEFLMMEPLLFVPVTSSVIAEGSPFWSYPLIEKYRDSMLAQMETLQNSDVIGCTKGMSLQAGAIENSYLLGEVLQKIVLDGWSAEQAVKWGHEQYEQILER